MRMFCANSSLLEKVVFDVQVATNNLISAFNNCPKLRVIEGNIIAPFAVVDSAFNLCSSLEEVRIIRLSKSISFSDSPKLSRASFICLVANATNTKPITITVHPDVYAKLTDEANAEWHQVLIDAAAKDITFATT